MKDHSLYESPLKTRYASKEMLELFSDNSKYVTWRRLWIALAENQKKLGLLITEEQIQELKKHLFEIDYAKVHEYESRLHHDVMAHLHAYGDLCPKAKPILHMGATSAYVTDNGDLIQYHEALNLIESKLKRIIQFLADFAAKYKEIPCLAFTHLQPAQPTTVGKRAALWLQDFIFDEESLRFERERLAFLGLKGATGSQSSFLTLFDKDEEKVVKLEKLIATSLGFKKILSLSGQTYSRKQDVHLLHVLTSIAISSHKFATDVRLLAHMKEIQEGFKEHQVGSSAMPHKRNPILCERICSLSRFVIALGDNCAYTAAIQWLERTLDDSANRRLTIPEAFLVTDSVLELLLKVIPELKVNESIIEKHLSQELPFLLAEEILMQAAKNGANRQEIHEKLRQYCLTAYSQNVSLIDLILQDPSFPISKEEITRLVENPQVVGRSKNQIDEFLKGIDHVR